jgi:uncharacterized protein YcbK (DUF882 family)
MLRMFFVLLTVTVSAQAAGADESAPGWPSSTDRALPAKPSPFKSVSHQSKRRIVKRPGKPLGWAVPEKELRSIPPEPPSGKLHVYSLSYKTEAEVNIYNPDGSFNVEALAEISHIFKCRRSGLEHDIDTRLLTILSHIYDHFGGKRLELLSGYRFQRRTTSNHFHGTAADIRIPGIDPRKVRAYVDTIDVGGIGVGYYPRVGFVHVDVRQPPSYRWIDYSRSNPDARDRQPPRGFKRKSPES